MVKLPPDGFLVPPKGFALKGVGYTRQVNGNLYWSKWPTQQKSPRSFAEAESRALFALAARATLYFDAHQQAFARDVAAKTVYLPRDLLMQALYARLAYIGRKDGRKIYSMVARQDVSEILDAVAQSVGDMLVRGQTFWEPIQRGNPGDYLQVLPDGRVGYGPSGASGAPWSIIAFWDHALTGNITQLEADIAGLDELQIIFEGVSASSAGWRCIQLSDDGGSTWYTNSQYLNILSGGTTSLDNAIYGHANSATAARTCWLDVNGFGTTSMPITANCPARAIPMQMATARGPMNRIRAFNNNGGSPAGVMNGGRVWICGR